MGKGTIWHVTAFDDWMRKPFIDEDMNMSLEEIAREVDARTPNALTELTITYVKTE